MQSHAHQEKVNIKKKKKKKKQKQFSRIDINRSCFSSVKKKGNNSVTAQDTDSQATKSARSKTENKDLE